MRQRVSASLSRSAGWILALGLMVVTRQNVQLWRRDRFLARQMRERCGAPPALARTPAVTALVAAWNEGPGLIAHLESFHALRYPAIDLVICAGGDDETLAIARRYGGSRVSVIEQLPGEGKQRALARAYTLAGGEIIFLTDADCRFDDTALAHLLAPLVNEGEQAATGVSRPLDEQRGRLLPAYLWSSDAVAAALSPPYAQGILGRNAAITRAALAHAGGLDFAAPTGTDYHLARRLLAAGVKIRHVAASAVASEYPETFGTYRRKQSRWLRNLLIYGPSYGALDDVAAAAVTVSTGVAMTGGPVAALILGRVVLVPWLLLLAHAVAAKLRYLLFAASAYGVRVSPRLLAALVPLKLADFLVWALALLDLLSRERRTRW